MSRLNLRILAISAVVLLSFHGPALGQATKILKETGVNGGLVVHLGCGDGRLTTTLLVGDSYLVN